MIGFGLRQKAQGGNQKPVDAETAPDTLNAIAGTAGTISRKRDHG